MWQDKNLVAIMGIYPIFSMFSLSTINVLNGYSPKYLIMKQIKGGNPEMLGNCKNSDP
jgi:hypothetical protein